MPCRAIVPLSPLVDVTPVTSLSKCESVRMNEFLFAIGMPGPFELLIVLFIMLLLFGGAKLPSLMRNLGASAREFKKGVQGMEEDLDEATKTVTHDNDE
jgi:sec-independent protein translocase protein TatA